MKKLAVLIVLSALAGCTSWRHNNPISVGSPWDNEFRQPTAPGQLIGVDSRSREIEQNLGIR